MTFIAYEPDPPMLESTISAFQKLLGPTIGCTIEPDPKGPVNQIISLVVGGPGVSSGSAAVAGGKLRRVKSVLWHVPAGAAIKVVHASRPSFSFFDTSWNCTLHEPGFYGYRVTIDGQIVLYASDSEIWPPTPAEPVPWRVRTRGAVKRWLRTRVRGAGDRVAARFGYVRGDEAGW